MSEKVDLDIKTRLQKIARKLDRPTQEILQYYAMERFLYRLSRSEFSEKFVLKGGLLLHVWNPGAFRFTRDIDLLGFINNQPDHIERICKDICNLGFDDGVVFDSASISSSIIQPGREYKGVQLKFKGLMERSKLHMQIDLGFSDAVHPEPVSFFFPTLLGTPSPRLLGYTKESVVAEKVDAMIQLGELNSRMKDFYDLWFLSHRVPFYMNDLKEALEATLRRRGTKLSSEPVIFRKEFIESPLKSEQWANFCRRNRLSTEPTFFQTMTRLKGFLALPLESLDRGEASSTPKKSLWNPERGEWGNRS